MAKSLLFQSIPETMILQFGNLDTVKAVWDTIKTRHMGADRVKEARLQTLTADFNRVNTKETESIDVFVGKLPELSTKSSSLGETIEELKLVKKFLNSLPRKKYIHIIAALEQVLDLNNTIFADIVGRLKAYEERICDDEEEKQEEQGQNKLMHTNTESQSYQERYQESHESGRGRSRGGRYVYRGRGRGRYGYQQNGGYYRQERDTGDASRVVCYRCDKVGQFAQACPYRLLKLQETQENEAETTQEVDELIMHEVVYLNERNVTPSKLELASNGENI